MEGNRVVKSIDDIPGWFNWDTSVALDTIIKEYKISQVIEIGSFLGKSTCFFLLRVLEVLAVDPFVMWPEGSQNGDAQREGGDDFFAKFMDNIIQMRVNNSAKMGALKVCRMTSQECFDRNPDLRADLIYIDAAHDYESVKSDIAMWRTRTNKIICGDDHDENWPGVIQAVEEELGEVTVVGNFWFKYIGEDIDWPKIKRMDPIMRKLENGKWEASVGTGFETSWWPEGIGDTQEEAIAALQSKLTEL